MILSAARQGPFVSATSHKVYKLGQTISVGGEQDGDDGNFTQKKKVRAPGARAARNTLTLLDLITAGILVPGRNKITVVYKGTTYTASLNKEGQIVWQGQKFSSATAFSIHCKRQQMPSKQGDDGWKSVLYEGLPLETFRRKFMAQDQPAEQATGDLDTEDLQAGERGEAAAGQAGNQAAQGTDQWVQCDRCKTWRIVPDSDWGAVQEDEREEWLCEYATWDLTDHAPFTAACETGREAQGDDCDNDNEEEQEEGADADDAEQEDQEEEDGESDQEGDSDDNDSEQQD